MPNQFIIPLVLAFDLLIGATVVGLILRYTWKPLERSFPAREPSEPFVVRKFQSFEIGYASFGFSVHVTIDDNCLHLTPAWIIRRFGMKPMSIPWEAIQPLPESYSRQKRTKVKISKQTITGPKWCFELVARPTQTKDS